MSAGKFRISAISCWSVGQGSHALKKAQRHGNARRTPPLFFRSSGWRAAYQDRGLGLGAWAGIERRLGYMFLVSGTEFAIVSSIWVYCTVGFIGAGLMCICGLLFLQVRRPIWMNPVLSWRHRSWPSGRLRTNLTPLLPQCLIDPTR
jgi:hypothetical protein